MSEIKPIHTPCKNCKFATWKDKTQTGCFFDRTKKFENVLEAYDEEKEFYIINGRQCNYFADNQKYTDDIVDVAELIIKKHKTRITFFIYIDDESLEEIVKSIKHQIIKPYEVYFVDLKKIGTSLNHRLTQLIGNEFTWRIIYPVVEFNVGEIPEFILQKAQGLFSVFLSSHKNIKYNWISQIDHLINVELKQTCFIQPFEDGISGFTTMPNMIKNFGLYSFKEVGEAILKMAIAENKENLILSAKEVYG